MSFNLNSSFVSREILDEQGNTKQLEWDKVRSEAEKADSTPNVPSEPYDPRTLYERLQEQKNMKEDAIKEAMRFSNLVKRVDDEEMEYYRTLTDTQLQAELEKKRQETKELEEYRKAVDQASNSQPPTVALPTKENDVAKTEAASVIKGQNKRKKSVKDLLQGVVVSKKRKGEEDEQATSEKSSTKRPHVEEQAAKQTKTDNQRSPPRKPTPPIQSLVAYGDDSSSSDEE